MAVGSVILKRGSIWSRLSLAAILVFGVVSCGGGGSVIGNGSGSNNGGTTPLAAPTGLQAVAGDKQVALFWSAVAGAISYDIYVGTKSGAATTLLGHNTASQYLDLNLTNGTARFYRVSALGANGESAPSDEVSATPSTSAAPLPPAEDPTRNQVGLGAWFNNDWDTASAFVDVFKQSRPWQDAQDWHNPVGGIDALGWPTADASTVLFTNTPDVVNGTYKLVFNGKAQVGGLWCDAKVANQAYDAISNTTTADVTLTLASKGSCGLVFTKTQRTASSAVGSGFANAHFYRPGYPSDGSKVFTDTFLNAFRAANVKVVRMMDWGGGSSDVVQHWADRAIPAAQTGLPTKPYTSPDDTVYDKSTQGVPLEYRIRLCNDLMVDCWINIPPVADDDFVKNTALALRFGTDGVNPYITTQKNPVFPPLNPSLRVYLEFANENWNFAGGFDAFGIEKAICSHLPAGHPLLTPANGIYQIMWRYPAWRMAAISETFRAVFGDAAMMTRVRPLLETQQGNAQGTLSEALTWLESYAATLPTPRKVSDLLYGGGGSAYYGVNANPPSAVPDAFFAAGNYPATDNLKGWATDSLWTYAHGIKHVAYEGGPSMDSFQDGNLPLNADPRMQTLVQATHDGWSASGGDLAVYYCLTGPAIWEFTPDITKTDTPKLKALAAIAAAPRAAVTLGAALPGTLAFSDPAISNHFIGSGYGTTIDGVACQAGNHKGALLAIPGHAAKAFSGSLKVRGGNGAATDTHLDVLINGVKQGTVTLAAQTGDLHLQDSTAISVSVPMGVVVLRLTSLDGDFAVAGVTIQ